MFNPFNYLIQRNRSSDVLENGTGVPFSVRPELEVRCPKERNWSSVFLYSETLPAATGSAGIGVAEIKALAIQPV